jgi:hypothetical protein
MLLEKIEALPEVQAARAEFGKHYLGAWWEFQGMHRESCGNRNKRRDTKGYCPMEANL